MSAGVKKQFLSIYSIISVHTHTRTELFPHCYSLHKSLYPCRNRRGRRYGIKAFPFSSLRPPPFRPEPFVTDWRPVPLTVPPQKRILIMALTFPHTYFPPSLCSSCMSLSFGVLNRDDRPHLWLIISLQIELLPALHMQMVVTKG